MNKVFRSILIAVLLLATMFTFAACAAGKGKLVGIEADPDTIQDIYDVENFSISNIYLILTYENEETERVPLEKTMIKAEDHVKLLVPGDQTITVTYRQKTTTFTLKLREGITGKHKVVFVNEDNSQIGDILYVDDGAYVSAPPAPSKPDYNFADWRDQYGNYSVLERIYENKTFTATFESAYCMVKFIHQSGVSILETRVLKGTHASTVAPAFPVVAGKTATGWDSPLTELFVDTTYTALYIDNTINVYYVFGADGRAPKVVNYPAYTMISPTDSPIVPHAEFLGWYTNDTFDGEMVTFPYLLQSEITFYAKYVSRTIGSSGLEYSYRNNAYAISGYSGDDDIIVIPEKHNNLDVDSIDSGVFRNAKNKSFSVTATNNYFSVTDGVLFDVNKEKIWAYPAGKESNRYNVPSSVIRIESYAFANAKNLMEINFLSNENLTYIGNYAFMNCTQLIEIAVPYSVQTIAEGALLMEEDSTLREIRFAQNAMLKEIGNRAFEGLNKLTSIELPSTRLDSIGSNVFYGCSQLRDITLKGDSSHFSSSKGVLYDKTAITLIAYPANNVQNTSATYVVPQGVETIKAGAFINANITGVSLPASIKSIEGKSFVSPKIQFLQFEAQNQPESVAVNLFGDGEFRPQYIIVPEGATNDYSAFDGYEIIESTPPQVFYYNSDTGYLYTKNIDNKLTIYGLRDQTADLVIPQKIDGLDIIGIGKYTFYNNKIIRNVTISEGVQFIEEYAFRFAETLESVILPKTLTRIAKGAFADCSRLSAINNNDGEELAQIALAEIAEETFLHTPWYDAKTPEFLTIGNVLIKYNGTGSQVTLPNNIKVIADSAFAELSNLTAITLNAGLETIGSYAFYGCSGIFHITIPASVSYIGEYAFVNCPNLYRITVLSTTPPTLSSLGEVFTTDAQYQSGDESFDFTVLVPFHISELYLRAYENDSQWSKCGVYERTSPMWGKKGLFQLNNRGVSFDSHVGALTTYDTNTVQVPPPPNERQGYVFAGWFDADEDGNIDYSADPVIFPYQIDAPKTFYARWYEENQGTPGLAYKLINDGNEYAVEKYEGTHRYVVVPNEYKGKPVTAVLAGAFSAEGNANNEYVYQIILPRTIRTIEKGAFEDTLWYDQFLGDFLSINDVLIEYRGSSQYVIVPDSIKYLVEGAFKNNTIIRSIIFPDAIEEMPKEVLYGCINLSEIKLPASLRKIGEKAFYGCQNLKQITFPQTVESVAPDALDETGWLKYYIDDIITVNNILFRYKGKQSTLHIPNTINSIERRAFMNNIFIKDIYMPNTVVTIGESAFENCINIQKVQFADGASIRNIRARAFYGCLMMVDFNFGTNSNVQEINDEAFALCNSLSAVEFPASLTVLGKGAYKGSGIQSVKFADRCSLTSILEDTFSDCRNLKTVVFGVSTRLSSIAANAFKNCTNLLSVDIPASNSMLTKIEAGAFYNCTSLMNVVLPSSLMEIGDDAFYAVPYVESNNDVIMTVGSVLLKYTGTDSVVVISKEVAAISKGAFANNTTLVSVIFENGSQLFAIGEEAFSNCSMLENINFPDTITHIGKDAFKGSKWLNDYADDFIIINNILLGYKGNSYQAIIPGNVTTIGIDAFNGNTRLRNIEVGAFVTKIMARAFNNMSQTSTITMLGANPPELDEDNQIPGRIYVETEAIFNNYRENESWSRFINDREESVIKKYKITFDLVYEDAYLENTVINTNAMYVEPIPTLDGYTFIGWYEVFNEGFEPQEPNAYADLIPLPFLPSRDITLYAKWIDNHSGTIVGELYTETMTPAGATAGTYLVGYSGADRYVMIPYSHSGDEIVGIAKSGGYSAFAYNDVIEEVTFVEGHFENGVYMPGAQIRYILEGAFENATSLRRIVLPASLQYIGANAFKGCTSLEEIIFTGGESGLIIEQNAFQGCTALKTITFPANVTVISDDAFAGCTNLRTIYMNGNMPPQGNSPFVINPDLVIYVNKSVNDSTVTAYKGQWPLYEQYIVSKP